MMTAPCHQLHVAEAAIRRIGRRQRGGRREAKIVAHPILVVGEDEQMDPAAQAADHRTSAQFVIGTARPAPDG
jgi:hypothetical protein